MVLVGKARLCALREDLYTAAPALEATLFPAVLYLPDPVITSILESFKTLHTQQDLAHLIAGNSYVERQCDKIWEVIVELRSVFETMAKDEDRERAIRNLLIDDERVGEEPHIDGDGIINSENEIQMSQELSPRPERPVLNAIENTSHGDQGRAINISLAQGLGCETSTHARRASTEAVRRLASPEAGRRASPKAVRQASPEAVQRVSPEAVQRLGLSPPETVQRALPEAVQRLGSQSVSPEPLETAQLETFVANDVFRAGLRHER
ncbi:uncharacterized protein B0H18DRAFT_1001168 [Fomitopsis serialis]|uniref:uncharacterized protein n=1 Tax=Fomitopsis serialis TaxID=139415 RepID=UPI002007A7DF|nr:uncharacterized protein B0H18DRAFT_1001168 [Neoantrodia serialis]KAH9928410.1 hypothetical protein B0H18DRAFT_1001168 [Neoantrodia serialis]